MIMNREQPYELSSDSDDASSTFSSSQYSQTSQYSQVSTASARNGFSHSSLEADFDPPARKKSKASNSKLEAALLRKEAREAKLLAKAQGEAQRQLVSQEAGKHREEEIAIILGKSLLQKPLGLAIKKVFAENAPKNGVFFSDTDTMVDNLFRFTFRQKRYGGKCNIGDNSCQVLAYAVIVFSAQEFIRLASLSTEELSYKELAGELINIAEMARAFDGCPQETCVVFIIMNAEAAHMQHRKKNTSERRAFDLDFDLIKAYLTHEMKLDVMFEKNNSDIAEYLCTFAKVMGNIVYKTDLNELDVQKKAAKSKPGDELSYQQRTNFKSQETWAAMLQQVFGLSKEKAKALISHHSCPQKLLEAYQKVGLTSLEKERMLDFCFSSNTASGACENPNKNANNNNSTVAPRCERKLSRQLWNLFVNIDDGSAPLII